MLEIVAAYPLELLHRTLAGDRSYFDFRLIGEEFVDGSSRTRAAGISIVIEQPKAPALHPGIENLTASFDRRVDIEIDVHERESPASDNYESLRNQSRDEAN